MALEDLGMTAAQMFGTEYVLVMFIFALLFNSLILWIITTRMNFKKNDYKYAFLVTLIMSCVSLLIEFFVPLSFEIWMLPGYFLIDVALIYLLYPEPLVKALKAGLVWWASATMVGFLLGLVIGVSLAAIGITTGTLPSVMWPFPA